MKLKVLLMNLKSPELAGQKKTYMPPVHLWKIRATLKEIKYISMVTVCDEHMGEDCRNYLKYKYDMVGISCRFSIQHKEYERVAELAKQSGAFVIAGGIHAGLTGKPRYVDVSTRYRGEEYFYQLFNHESKEIDNYPIPYFEESEIKHYWDKNRPHDLQSKTEKWISMVTSVGCDRRCGFCAINFGGNNWIPHSMEYIEKHFEYLQSKGIEEIFFEDDNISWDKNRFMRIIELLNKYGFWWSCPNGIYASSLLDENVIKRLAGSGCWRLSLPFETGSERTAKLMGLGTKWMSRINADYLVNRLRKLGILTCGFFIIGYPGETEEDIKKTFDYANSLNLDQRNIYIATPYPGTQLFKDCIQKGYISVDNDFYGKLLYKNAVINTPWLSAERIMELKAEDREKAIQRNRLTNIK